MAKLRMAHASRLGQQFTHGRFPEVGQKQKTERKRKKERLNDGNNNGQLCIATPPRVAQSRKAVWANYNSVTVSPASS